MISILAQHTILDYSNAKDANAYKHLLSSRILQKSFFTFSLPPPVITTLEQAADLLKLSEKAVAIKILRC